MFVLSTEMLTVRHFDLKVCYKVNPREQDNSSVTMYNIMYQIVLKFTEKLSWLKEPIMLLSLKDSFSCNRGLNCVNLLAIFDFVYSTLIIFTFSTQFNPFPHLWIRMCLTIMLAVVIHTCMLIFNFTFQYATEQHLVNKIKVLIYMPLLILCAIIREIFFLL